MRHYLFGCRDAQATVRKVRALVGANPDFGEIFAFPPDSKVGYVLIEMEATPNAIKLLTESGLGRLVGDQNPKALSEGELKRVRQALHEGLEGTCPAKIVWSKDEAPGDD